MDILEKLWAGDICPREFPPPDGEEYRACQRAVTEAEQALLLTLSPQGRAALERYQRSCTERSSLLDRDSFICGFRLGAQILLSALENEGES